MTNSQQMRLSAVMISSTMPSAKYSCSGSPLRLAKGNTAIDGFVGERQGQCTWRSWRIGSGTSVANPVDPHRPGNVLDLLLAEILKDKRQPIANVIMNRVGDEHPAGIGQGFDPCGDIDAVAIEVIALDDHVAEIDADAQLDAVVRRGAAVALRHRLLHFDRTAHGIDDAAKFHQHPVAGGLATRPRCSAIFGSTSSRRNALRRSSVPSSSAPISREYPATSAARIAARRRVWLTSPHPPSAAGRTGTARDARRSAGSSRPISREA